VRDPSDRAIVGGDADGGVKGGILSEAGPPGGDLPRLVFEDPFHLLDLFRRRAARRERRDGRLEHPPGLEELPDRLTLRGHHEGQGATSASIDTWRTNVPSPGRISMSPRLSSARSASRTEVRLTTNFSARSRSAAADRRS